MEVRRIASYVEAFILYGQREMVTNCAPFIWDAVTMAQVILPHVDSAGHNAKT